ncbi:MAG: MerR family transcriptional regulator [Lachnospiraceae bacterium]|nr:MerR family transcriptional regulator [Lachnospiraceae bacterium]
MMTVKDISRLTGISARTLHYYDEIGLFTPTEKSEAGYRLYDDKALKALQQILFFREFDIPLKEIKAVMTNPALDRNSILSMQRKMLVAKKERMERLIASIDNILKGDKKMDFSVFNETDIQALYDSMVENMNSEMKEVFIKQYGSMDAFKKNFLKNAGSEQAQKNFAKLVEWYGNKEAVLEASQRSAGSEVFTSCQKRMGDIQEKLTGMVGTDVNSLEIRALVVEYEFVSKQLYQMSDVKPLLLEMAKEYQNNKEVQAGIDSVYGVGATAYLGEALEAYYKQ